MAVKARAAINQSSLIGIQAAEGTAVAATKRLLCTGFTFAPNSMHQENKPEGFKFITSAPQIKEETKVNFQGIQNYVDICYLLSCFMQYNTPSTAAGVTTWSHTTNATGTDTGKFMTVVRGGQTDDKEEVYDAKADSLTLNFSRDDVSLSGSMIAKAIRLFAQPVEFDSDATGGTFTITYNAQTTAAIDYDATAAEIKTALVSGVTEFATTDIDAYGGDLATNPVILVFKEKTDDPIQPDDFTIDNASMTGGTDNCTADYVTETEIDEVPMRPQEVDFYIADTYAGLATADPLCVSTSANLTISGKYASQYFICSENENSYGEIVDANPDAKWAYKGNAVKDVLELAEYMRLGSTLYFRVVATGGEIAATGTDFSMQIDSAIKITSWDGLGAENNLDVGSFTFTLAKDAVWGQVLSITTVNELSAL